MYVCYDMIKYKTKFELKPDLESLARCVQTLLKYKLKSSTDKIYLNLKNYFS